MFENQWRELETILSGSGFGRFVVNGKQAIYGLVESEIRRSYLKKFMQLMDLLSLRKKQNESNFRA